MNKEKIDTSKLIEEINNTSIKGKKTSCSILGIFLVFFSILIILYVSNKTSSYLYVAIICLLIVLLEVIVIICKNKFTKEMNNELLKIKDEIDNYCENLGNDIYSTKNRILMINPSSIKQIVFSNIVSCTDSFGYRSSGDNYTKYPTIVVTMNDAKKITLKSSNRLKELLSKYYSGNKEDNKIDGESIRSQVIKDFYKFDDYQQGYIDLPLFSKKDCSLWIDSDVSIDYADKVAKVIKELTETDIDSAKESTIWYHNNDINENGYHKELTNVPLRINKDDVLKYLELEEIYIRKQSNNEIMFTIWFKTELENEHGISWVFKDKKIIYVGPGSDIDEENLNVEYNFAKSYHQEVKLKNEE